MDERNEETQGEAIKLDGSLGFGDNALLTIITKDDLHGEKEETFQFPYALINFDVLTKYATYKLILGYKIVRQEKPKEEVA